MSQAARCYVRALREDDRERDDEPRLARDRLELERERPDDDFGGGTLAPFLRASDNPIAIACFRLVTRPPRPDFPDFSVPCFFRRMALSTDLEAASP
jgi:hypothetical protein